MSEFYDDVLIKLKRKYGKDDLVRSLISQIEILKNELLEWNCVFEKKVKLKVKERVLNLEEGNKELSKQNSKLRKTNSHLITELNYERNKNKELKKDSV